MAGKTVFVTGGKQLILCIQNSPLFFTIFFPITLLVLVVVFFQQVRAILEVTVVWSF